MTGPIDLTGKVAIVTGAGNGLGRCHALLLASRGASVVVNDLGVDVGGNGRTSAMAESVVGVIRQAGGTAVADANDIGMREGAMALHDTAIDNFGRADIIVNNAGIIRDAYFHKAEMEDLELVLRVHLNGPMYLSHAAYPGMRERRYGRIIFTSSVTGVYGNPAQSTYGMGKAGVIGLMMTLAMEGSSYNVLSNAVMPTAVSRMTGSLMPQAFQNTAYPEHVAALIGNLSSPGCLLNGNTISAGAGMYAAIAPIEARGVHFDPSQEIRPEDIAAHVDKIVDFDEPYRTGDLSAALDHIKAGLHTRNFTPLDRSGDAKRS